MSGSAQDSTPLPTICLDEELEWNWNPELEGLQLPQQQPSTPCLLIETFFPTDFELASLASDVYEDKQLGDTIELMCKGRNQVWTVLATAFNMKKGGYYGAAYWNSALKQLVITHRGTKSIAGGLTDVDGIIAHQLTQQVHSACTFTALLLEVLKSLTTSSTFNFYDCQLSFCGHSLGGWLAQITAFVTKYLTLNESKEFVLYRGEDERRNGNASIYHPHTVGLDSPGCLEMLNVVARLFYKSQEVNDRLFHNLDITLYLSRPNLVNTLNKHVGTIYQLQLELDEYFGGKKWEVDLMVFSFKKLIVSGVKGKSLITYTDYTHSVERLVATFNHDTGFPTQGFYYVTSWPSYSFPSFKSNSADKAGDSFLGKLAQCLTQVVNLRLAGSGYADATQLNWYLGTQLVGQSGGEEDRTLNDSDHHYYSFQIFPQPCTKFSVFSERERSALDNWSGCFQQLRGNIFLHDKMPRFDIDVQERLATCLFKNAWDTSSKISSPGHVPFLKQLFKLHPAFSQFLKDKSSEMPAVFEAYYKAITRSYLAEMRTGYLDVHGWQFDQDSEIGQLLRGEGNFVIGTTTPAEGAGDIVAKLVSLAKAQGMEPCFLSLRQLLSLQQLSINVETVYQDEKAGVDKLLIIDSRATELGSDSFGQRLLCRLESISSRKRLIVIKNCECDPSRVFKCCHVQEGGIKFSEFSPQERKQLFRSPVNFQGSKSTKLEELLRVVADQELEGGNMDELSALLDSNTLRLLMRSSVSGVGELEVGFEPVQLSDTGVCTIQIGEKVGLEQFLAYAISSSDSGKYTLLVSGHISEGEKGAVRESGANCQFVESSSTDEASVRFKLLCRCFENEKVFWLHLTEEHACVWKQVYDASLYKTRYFFQEVVIDNNTHVSDLTSGGKGKQFFVIRKSDRSKLNEIFDLTFLKEFDEKERLIVLDSADYENPRIAALENCGDQVLPIKGIFGQMVNKLSYHYVRVKGKAILWDHTEGSIINLRCHYYNSPDAVLDEEEFAKLNNKIIILTGEPGMGKSTVLYKLLDIKLKESLVWVIAFNLKDSHNHLDCVLDKNVFFDEAPKELVLNQIVEFLFQAAGFSHSKHPFAKGLLRLILNPQPLSKFQALPLCLIFDGFDEIYDQSPAEKVLYILYFLKTFTRASVIVTTRYNQKWTLEQFLGGFASKFQEILPADRLSYLNEFWSISTCTPVGVTVVDPNYAQNVLKVANGVLGEDEAAFMGIPLQLRMLADTFRIPWQKNADIYLMSVTDLYSRFVSLKYQIYLREKLGMGENPQNFNSWIIQLLTSKHKRLACKEILHDYSELVDFNKPPFEVGEDGSIHVPMEEHIELCRVGLLQAGLSQPQLPHQQPSFIHRTFAEYFVALYFSTIVRGKRAGHPKYQAASKMITQIFNDESEFKVVRRFLHELIPADEIGKAHFFQPNIVAENIGGNDGPDAGVEPRRALSSDVFRTIMKENRSSFIKTLLLPSVNDLFDMLRNCLLGLDESGKSGLHLALEAGSEEATRQLIETLAMIGNDQSLLRSVLLQRMGREGTQQQTTFHLLCKHGRASLVDSLLTPFLSQLSTLKELLMELSFNARSGLMLAAGLNMNSKVVENVVNFLISHVPPLITHDILLQANVQGTLLNQALKFSHGQRGEPGEVVRALRRPLKGQTYLETMRALVTFEVPCKGESRKTILQRAAEKGESHFIECLLEELDDDGETVRALLETKCEEEVEGSGEKTTPILASVAPRGNLETFKTLIKTKKHYPSEDDFYKKVLLAKTSYNQTILFIVAISHELEFIVEVIKVLKWSIKNLKEIVQMADDTGVTLLRTMLDEGKCEFIKAIISELETIEGLDSSFIAETLEPIAGAVLEEPTEYYKRHHSLREWEDFTLYKKN